MNKKGNDTLEDITAKEVAVKLADKENINIIDVREEEEVAAGMIPDAVHIPLNTVPDRVHELDKNKEYIVVCHSGGRSGKAKAFLTAKGISSANMSDGMSAWTGPTE